MERSFPSTGSPSRSSSRVIKARRTLSPTMQGKTHSGETSLDQDRDRRGRRSTRGAHNRSPSRSSSRHRKSRGRSQSRSRANRSSRRSTKGSTPAKSRRRKTQTKNRGAVDKWRSYRNRIAKQVWWKLSSLIGNHFLSLDRDHRT